MSEKLVPLLLLLPLSAIQAKGNSIQWFTARSAFQCITGSLLAHSAERLLRGSLCLPDGNTRPKVIPWHTSTSSEKTLQPVQPIP